jgi:hypothetical protein
MAEQRGGKVTNIVEGAATNVTQVGNTDGDGGEVTNIVNGDATNVFQAGTITGGVHIGR